MLVKDIKQLFIAGFLGLSLVGCSSTPTSTTDETQAEASKAEMAAKDAATQQVESDIDAAKMAKANALAAQKAELLAAIQGKTVRFDFDKSDIKSEFYSVIKANADYLSLETSATVTIEGHCDERGTREYNLALGERRGNAVKNALVAEGVSPSRITVISYGEDKPAAEGHNESAWELNRRAEFKY